MDTSSPSYPAIPHLLSRIALLAIGGLLSLGLLIVTLDYIDGYIRRRAFGSIPIVDEHSRLSYILRWFSGPFDALEKVFEAYEKYSKANIPFVMRIQGDHHAISLPPSSGKEIRAIGHEKLSFLHALNQFADMYMHTNVLSRTPIEAVHSCSNEATMKKFQEQLAAEADKHLPPVFNPLGSQDWTEVTPMKAVFKAISPIATSLILGPNSPHAVEFTALAAEYNRLKMANRRLRGDFPRFLRPVVWQFAPTCRGLRKTISLLKVILLPEIQRRVNIVRSGTKHQNGHTTGFSLLDALIEATIKNGSLSRRDASNDAPAVDLIAQQLMLFHFELSRATGVNIVFLLYRIMNHPEYVQPLRDEITKALETSGGEWVFDMLKLAPKLESFNREVFRMHDISVFINIRLVMQTVHLDSVNLTLKPGTLISTPSRPVHFDPLYYPDPYTFNGYRFYDAETNTCSPRISTTSATYLPWSHGPGACPARNIASQITRVMFIKLLMLYDFRVANEVMPDYERIVERVIYFPNPDVRMGVRPRKG
ncbi:cytochrome P450 [Aspergillus karnatakaensis]|uniref:cytochrome P450 n=1 Tax=Aspergillus karnatakaensis TaxID=1810916 RepID=UPI003CCDC2CF